MDAARGDCGKYANLYSLKVACGAGFRDRERIGEQFNGTNYVRRNILIRLRLDSFEVG